ncbi:MAG: hypothetical protein ABSC22_04980 [Roseiarcus sp.]|jgi:hypothetical protein
MMKQTKRKGGTAATQEQEFLRAMRTRAALLILAAGEIADPCLDAPLDIATHNCLHAADEIIACLLKRPLDLLDDGVAASCAEPPEWRERAAEIAELARKSARRTKTQAIKDAKKARAAAMRVAKNVDRDAPRLKRLQSAIRKVVGSGDLVDGDKFAESITDQVRAELGCPEGGGWPSKRTVRRGVRKILSASTV